MMISFFSGLAFTPWRREARWIVGIMAVTALCLIIFKALLPDVPRAVIGSVVHLVLWPVALVIAWAPGARAKRKTSDSESVWGRLFFFWLLWVSLLIGLSLLMDVREVASLLGEQLMDNAQVLLAKLLGSEPSAQARHRYACQIGDYS